MLFILGWDILFNAPSRPPKGEVASFAPFHICKMQIHGSDAASEDAFASLLIGCRWIFNAPPVPLWGKWHPLRLSIFAKCKYTARTRRLRTPSLRSYWVTVYYGAPPVPQRGKWHPLRLSIFAKCKYTARMRHLRMPSLRSYWVTVILWSPSRPLMGEVASFAPFHIC